MIPAETILVREPAVLLGVATRMERAERIALDVEANGLFAYRTHLCVVQAAWHEAGALVVAIVDPLAVSVAPLGRALGPEGPVKVLHDLTFDAKLLAEQGTPIGRVQDTSVAARMLGIPAVGLAALVGSELGARVDKRFQHHDWSRRPLASDALAYLADDVRYLLALNDALRARVLALDIGAEVDDETAHKLATATLPPRDTRPAYARIKGVLGLDEMGRAVLRRIVAARELIAERLDVPPFKVVGNDTLLELARVRPADTAALGAIRGASVGRSRDHRGAWLEAVAAGVADGAVPDSDRTLFESPPPNRAAVARRRALDTAMTRWRAVEAKTRNVDVQVVLPGHCLDELVALGSEPTSLEALEAAITKISGFGRKRAERYGRVLAELVLRGPASLEQPA